MRTGHSSSILPKWKQVDWPLQKVHFYFIFLKVEKQNISIPNIMCVAYCTFSTFLRVDIQTWKTQGPKQKSGTIIIIEFECHNTRGYVRVMWKLGTYFSLELTLCTQHPNTWPEKHLIPHDILSVHLCVIASHQLLGKQSYVYFVWKRRLPGDLEQSSKEI